MGTRLRADRDRLGGAQLMRAGVLTDRLLKRAAGLPVGRFTVLLGGLAAAMVAAVVLLGSAAHAAPGAPSNQTIEQASSQVVGQDPQDPQEPLFGTGQDDEPGAGNEGETCHRVGVMSHPGINSNADSEEEIDCGDCATTPDEDGGCIPKMKTGRDDELGQAPAALSWIKLTDSRGTSVWNYELSIDNGGLTDPWKILWSFWVHFWWGIYMAVVVLAIWFIDWVLTFQFLELIAAPFVSIGDSLQSVVDQIGVAPTFLTLAGAIAVVWMARGRWATGIWELCVSVLIAALATGMFGDPVRAVAGPDGLLMDTRLGGMEFASALANGGEAEAGAEALREDTTGMLVDILVRQPLQVLNFGAVIDGTKCESAYNEVIDAGPYGSDDDIRDEVGDCDDQLGDYAGNPDIGMAMSAWAILPAGWTIVLFVLVFAVAVLGAVGSACWQAVRSIITTVTGLIPGARHGLFMTIAELVMSLVVIVFAYCFLVMSLMLVEAVIAEQLENGMPPMATFVILDIVVLVCTVMFWRYRKRLKQSAERLAKRMEATRPGPGPSRMPSPGHSSIWNAAARAGLTAYAIHRFRSGGGNSSAPPPGGVPRQPGRVGWPNAVSDEHGVRVDYATVKRPGLPSGQDRPLELGSRDRGASPDSGGPAPAGPGGPGAPAGGPGMPTPGAGRRGGRGSGGRGSGRRSRGVPKGVRVGVRAAAAYATGGTSSAASFLAKSAAREGGRRAGRRAAQGPRPAAQQQSRQAEAGGPTVRPRPMRAEASRAHATQYRRVVRDGQVLYVPRD